MNTPRARARAFALVLTLAAGAALAADGAPLQIAKAWARPTPPAADVAAVYFELRNGGPAADRLLGASTPVARRVEIHETRLEGGVARMQRVEALPVPAGGRVEFRPKGLHVMLFGLQQRLEPGARFPLELQFERAGRVRVEVQVGEAPAADAQHDHHHHH